MLEDSLMRDDKKIHIIRDIAIFGFWIEPAQDEYTLYSVCTSLKAKSCARLFIPPISPESRRDVTTQATSDGCPAESSCPGCIESLEIPRGHPSGLSQ
jgi:hypothetical protein